MRRFFYGVGVIATAAVLFFAGYAIVFYVYAVHSATMLAADAQRYADESVIAITAHWDRETLRARATPQLGRSMKPEDLHEFFEGLSTLGPLVDYQGSNSGVFIPWTIGIGASTIANYTARAKYANGMAEIQLALVKAGPGWLIAGFKVTSPALWQRAFGTPS
jgi:hypothetical protein